MQSAVFCNVKHASQLRRRQQLLLIRVSRMASASARGRGPRSKPVEESASISLIDFDAPPTAEEIAELEALELAEGSQVKTHAIASGLSADNDAGDDTSVNDDDEMAALEAAVMAETTGGSLPPSAGRDRVDAATLPCTTRTTPQAMPPQASQSARPRVSEVRPNNVGVTAETAQRVLREGAAAIASAAAATLQPRRAAPAANFDLAPDVAAELDKVRALWRVSFRVRMDAGLAPAVC